MITTIDKYEELIRGDEFILTDLILTYYISPIFAEQIRYLVGRIYIFEDVKIFEIQSKDVYTFNFKFKEKEDNDIFYYRFNTDICISCSISLDKMIKFHPYINQVKFKPIGFRYVLRKYLKHRKIKSYINV